MTTPSWGILIAGIGGFTGTTFALGVRSHQLGLADAAPTVTSTNEWKAAGLPSLDDVVVSGWDTSNETLLSRALRQEVLPSRLLLGLSGDEFANSSPLNGVHMPSDFASGAAKPTHAPLAHLQDQIRNFKLAHAIDNVVTVILLPPELPLGRPLAKASPSELIEACTEPDLHHVRSSQLYVLASVLEGCSVIDFTANGSLELSGIQKLAEASGVPLAGRDGSTGETALKLHLADFFRDRKLRVAGWYGTNILGNPDGLALTEPARRELKMIDKTEGLQRSLGYDVPDHRVSIDYYRPRGDNKEFWDVVDIETWLGGAASLRLNWIGPDSLLAGQILCDLTKIMSSQLVRGRAGIVPELGYFFKQPLGTPERSLARLWQSLHSLLDRV